jgi:hypothetical protein
MSSAYIKTLSKKPQNKKSNLKRGRNTTPTTSIEPDFLSQFEEQRFEVRDENSDPSALNDVTGYGTPSTRDLFKHQIASSGRWSQFSNTDGTYGVEEVTADGLMPLYRNKGSYGPDSQMSFEEMDYKRELFTGSLKDQYRKKEVIGQIFDPRPMDDPYGTPIYSASDLRSRVNIGDTYKGIQPIESQQVSPGLNLGYNGHATHGLHDPHRVMPASIDQMRFKPKVSYEGRINETVLKHVERPMVAPVISHKVPRYTEGKKEDMMPKGSIIHADKHRANPELRPTDRVNQLTEYIGHASTTTGSMAKPEHLRGAHEESRRQNFTMPLIEHKYSKDQTKFNSNTQDYYVPTTMRDIHSTQQIGIPTGSTKAAPAQDQKPLDTTLQQTTLHESRKNITGPQQSATETHNWHPLKTTIGETTLHENQMHVTGVGQQGQASTFNRDPFETTAMETTLHPSQIYVTGTKASTTDAQSWQPLKKTVHETTMELPRSQFIAPQGQHQGAASTSSRDPLPITTQQTTLHEGRSYLTGVSEGAASTASRDPLKQTIQETTLHEGRSYVTGISEGAASTASKDPLKQTILETTLHGGRSYVAPQGQAQGRASTVSRDPLRPTIQQTTLHEGRSYITGPRANTTDASNWLPARKTIQETTLHERTGASSVAGQGQTQGRATSFNRTPLATTKAETLLHERTGSHAVRGPNANLTDAFDRTPTRTTIMQTNLHENTGSYAVTGPNANLTDAFNRDPTRTTKLETTLHQQVGAYGVTGQNSNQTNTLDRTPFRTTKQQTTLHQKLGMTTGPKGSTTDTTNWIPARTTKQETTLHQKLGMTTGPKGSTTDASNWVPLKRTVRETTVQNKYVGQADGTNVIGKGHGYLTENHSVPTTKQETTLIRDHVKPITGPDAQTIYDSYYDVELPEDKVALSTINRAPTASNVSLTPNPDHVNYQLRTTPRENTREMHPTQLNYSLDQLANGYVMQSGSNNLRTITDMSRGDRTLDADMFASQLASNPYHQNILSAL